ncbi:hypothetical protein BTS2_3370 [Bacillus sp. TS-2]|nr:hypothetical protein BTS2_3370 [Bacillus sp. TS-2]
MHTVASPKTTKQKLKIDGVKFFKKHLDQIRLDLELSDPITASEIVVFMILHMHTDEMGQIRSLTKDSSVSLRKQLCISNISIEHDLKYETTKKAFDRLLEKNYISEVHLNEGMHYEIVNYAKYNQSSPRNEEKLSYFEIPKAIFEEKFFSEIIKQRFNRAALYLLELSQYFNRQIGQNRSHIDDPIKVEAIRTMKGLKDKLQTTPARIRSFLKLIHRVFLFSPLDEMIKKPSSSRTKRVRTFNQTVIKKFKLTLNAGCFIMNDENEERKTFAGLRKEMAARIKYANIPVKRREQMDINKSIRRMVKISKSLEIINLSKDMLRYTVTKVADVLEEMKNTGEFSKVRNIGAFANKLFTTAWEDYKRTISDRDRIKAISHYASTYNTTPFFLKVD